MKTGDFVKFKIYDTLFKDVIEATGVVISPVYGKLWNIKPDSNLRLSGDSDFVHEDFIYAD